MYINMYQIEDYLIEIPDTTPENDVFDKVLEEWNMGDHTPDDSHTFIGDTSLKTSESLLNHALELHQYYLEEFRTNLYQKLVEKYNDNDLEDNDIYIASVVDSTIKVEYKFGHTLHSKVIKAETIDKALAELESFFG